MKHKSRLDPSRDTVGYIYRQAQLHGEKQIITGDMNYELRKSLADDINTAIKLGRTEFEGRQFYITVYEKRDLVMKNAFHRELTKTKYRPWPEADTLVFRVQPYAEEVYFCWELPQRAHMINELSCPELYDESRLAKYRRWENMQLEHFGFMKNDEGNWIENPLYRGDTLLCATNESARVSMHKIDNVADGPHATF
jgi:hypothetical protein